MNVHQKAPTWKSCRSWAIRLNDCATALTMHGLLTEKERERVHQRLMKRIRTDSETEATP